MFQDHDESQVVLIKNSARASNSETDRNVKAGPRRKKVTVTLARNARNYDLEKSVSFQTPYQQPVSAQTSQETATQKAQDNANTVADLFNAYTKNEDLMRLDTVKPVAKAQSHHTVER